MQAVIQKWGNSLAFRIPKSFANATNIELGLKVELEIVKGNIVLKPIKDKKYKLDELLSQIDEDNIHKEVDFGKAEGKEIW